MPTNFQESDFSLTATLFPFDYTIGDYTGTCYPDTSPVTIPPITPAMPVLIQLSVSDSGVLELSLQPDKNGNPTIEVVRLGDWMQGENYLFSYAAYGLQITLSETPGPKGQPIVGIVIVGTTDIPR